MFDKDNTLTAPYARHVHPSVEVRCEFDGAPHCCWPTPGCEARIGRVPAGVWQRPRGCFLKLCWQALLHVCDCRGTLMPAPRHAGSADDTDFAHAAALERDLGVPVLKHGTKVRMRMRVATLRVCVADVTQKPGGAHAIRAALRVGTLAHVALIGDRYLTDVAFGNRVGASLRGSRRPLACQPAPCQACSPFAPLPSPRRETTPPPNWCAHAPLQLTRASASHARVCTARSDRWSAVLQTGCARAACSRPHTHLPPQRRVGCAD